MNIFKNNVAILDLIYSIKNYYSWSYLAYFDLKLKYRKTYLGPWWVVVGMAISAGVLCLLWSTIFNLDWKNFLGIQIQTGCLCPREEHSLLEAVFFFHFQAD